MQAPNLLQQQGKFDEFIRCYNEERPQQARIMRCPAELYAPSTRPCQGIGELEYPLHDFTIKGPLVVVFAIGNQKIDLSTPLADRTSTSSKSRRGSGW